MGRIGAGIPRGPGLEMFGVGGWEERRGRREEEKGDEEKSNNPSLFEKPGSKLFVVDPECPEDQRRRGDSGESFKIMTKCNHIGNDITMSTRNITDFFYQWIPMDIHE